MHEECVWILQMWGLAELPKHPEEREGEPGGDTLKQKKLKTANHLFTQHFTNATA